MTLTIPPVRDGVEEGEEDNFFFPLEGEGFKPIFLVAICYQYYSLVSAKVTHNAERSKLRPILTALRAGKYVLS